MSRFKPLLLLVAMVVAAGVPLPGHAGSSVGSFEIEGDTVDSPAGEPIDWDTPPPNLVAFTDGTGSTDDAFGSGSKENTPNEWDFVLASSPGKADLLSGAIAYREISGETFVYVQFTRADENGDTFTNFEFNQSSAEYVNSTGDSVPVRTAGDLMIAMFVTNGGSQRTIELREWSGDQFSGSWTLLGSCVAAPDCDTAVNADSKGHWTFAEAAIRLTAFLPPSCPGLGKVWMKTTSSQSFDKASLQDRTTRHDLNLSNCASKTFQFSFDPAPIAGTSVFAVYTPSDGIERELQLTDPGNTGTFTATDNSIPVGSLSYRFEVRNANGVVWAGPTGSETFAEKEQKTNVGSLHYEVLLTPASAENFAGRDHVLTATVREVGTNVPLVGVTVNFAVTGSCGSVSPASATTDSNGQATTTLTSSGACTTSVSAFVDGAGGTAGSQDQGEAAASADKVFVSYAISVSPASAVNVAGSDHTFTVTLTRDTGSGAVPYAGRTVDLTLNAGTTDAHFTSINGDPASGTSGMCITKADGTCEVVITSTTTGSVSLSASYTTINDSGEGTVDNHGDKLFEDFRVSVSPGSAQNEVGDPHTLTVLVEKDTGSGFAPVAGVNVTLSLDPGTSDAHFVSINGDPASGTSGTCVTKADGTCEVVIVATTPGSATLTAVIDEELDSGTLHREGSGDKLYSDFALAVTPGSATNEVGQEHTFTVTLTRNDGNGFFGYAGQTITLTLDAGTTDAHFTSINGDPASGTSGSCVTQVGGTCSVVIVSTIPGAVSLSAHWEGQLSTTSSAERSAQADKTYIEVTLTKVGCPTTHAPPGGAIDYTLELSVNGADLHDATLVDHLPASVLFGGASPDPTSDPGAGNTGDVTWDLGTVPAGSSLTFTISGVIDPGTASGTTAHNVAELSGEEIATKTAIQDLTVTTAGASAGGRAFGIQYSLLGGLLTQAPDPDTDVTNPGKKMDVDVLPFVDDDVLTVSNSGGVAGGLASDTAIATTNHLAIAVAGVTVTADTVVARSASTATGTTAGSSRSGSKIQDLVVNGTKYGDVTEPKTITVKDPLSGAVIAEVRVLNTTKSGAAAGILQPDGGFFSSGLAINGIEVVTPGLPPALTSSITVAHAESAASYPDGRPCNTAAHSVNGDAYLVNVFNVTPDAAVAQLGLVTLPSTGGADDAAVADTTPLGVITGSTHTEGTLSPLAASSYAFVNDLDVLGGTITATTIRAESSTSGGSTTRSTTIEDLDIAGTDVCGALSLTSTCSPAANTILVLDSGNVIVLLNEQAPASGRVNAVHIFVIGAGNPLGLPAGAEIIISSASSGTA
jgi:hypothetical protein